ncbi:MAG TPA: hypothetical protein VEQ65_10515 [Opitutus sp.]|nr:hypothetical protein [Opitutus sp.]
MRALKAFFLSRLLREKLLLVLFVALGAITWASSFSKRANRDWRGIRNVSTELATQAEWLNNRTAIEEASVQAVQNLDPARTLDGTRLVGELSAMAREHSLRFTNDTPQTERSAQFAVHTVQIQLQRAEWERLYDFYVAVSRRSPYVGVEQFSLVADRANPKSLNAALRISSVEIVR